MDFTKATNNGIQPPSDYKTKNSKLGVAVSNTGTIYGRPVTLTAISDAAMYKTSFVTFYSEFTPLGSSTSTTVTLGTSSFVTTTNAPLIVNTLGTGTHNIYVTWPGENKFAPQTTINNPVATSIDQGADPGGQLDLYISPASGTMVTGEGSVTLTAVYTGPTTLTGNFIFYDGYTKIGEAPIANASASFVLDLANIAEGTHDFNAFWSGDRIDGTEYQGLNAHLSYEILHGAATTATMTLTASEPYGVFQENPAGSSGVILTSTLNYPTDMPGYVSFYKNGELFSTSSWITGTAGKIATTTFNNTFAVGTYTFTSVWNGNQDAHPRYMEVISNELSWEVKARRTIDTFTLTVNPEQLYYSEEVTLTALPDWQGDDAAQINVKFYDNGNLIGDALASKAGGAVLTIPTLSTGSHALVAVSDPTTVKPKFFSSTTNVVNTVTSAGFPLNLSVEFVRNNSGDPTPGYYINEVQKVVVTNNSTTNISGSPITIGIDNEERYAAHEIVHTTGTSTILTGTNLSKVIVGDKVYSDPYLQNLIGTVTSTGTGYMVIDTPVNLGTAPVWFIGPDYEVLTTSTTFNASTATVTKNFTHPTRVVSFADWAGGRFDYQNHVYMAEHVVSSPINVTARPMPALTLSISTASGYVGEPVTLSIAPTNQYFRLNGFENLLYTTNSSGTTSTSTLALPSTPSTTKSLTFYSTGTQTLRMAFFGNGYIPSYSITPSRNYFFATGTSTLTNTVSVSLQDRFLGSPIIIGIGATPDYQGEASTIVLSSTSTVNLSGSTATVYVNGTSIGDVTFVGNSANTSTIINSTGTATFTALWQGGLLNNNKYYHSQYAVTATETITWHTLPTTPSIANTVSTYSTLMPIALTANLNTTTNLGGTFTFSVPGRSFTSTVTNSTSSYTVSAGTLATGNYTISGHWNGTSSVPYYFGKDAGNQLSVAIIAPGTPTVNFTNATTYYAFLPDGATNTGTMVTVAVSTPYSQFPPTGTLTIKNAANNSVLTSTSITAGGNYNFYWDSLALNQLDTTVSLRAEYSGNNYNLASSGTSTLTILKALSPTTLVATPNPLTRFSSTVLTATKPSNYNLTSSVTFRDDVAVLGTSTFTNNVASLTLVPKAGTYQISATYNGDSRHEISTSTATLQVNRFANIPRLAGNYNYPLPLNSTATISISTSSIRWPTWTVHPIIPNWSSTNVTVVGEGAVYSTQTVALNIDPSGVGSTTGVFTATSGIQGDVYYYVSYDGNTDYDSISNHGGLTVWRQTYWGPANSYVDFFDDTTYQSKISFDYIKDRDVAEKLAYMITGIHTGISTSTATWINQSTSQYEDSVSLGYILDISTDNGSVKGGTVRTGTTVPVALKNKTSSGPFTYKLEYQGDQFNNMSTSTSVSFTVYDFRNTVSISHIPQPTGVYQKLTGQTAKQTFTMVSANGGHAPWGYSSTRNTLVNLYSETPISRPPYQLPTYLWTVPLTTGSSVTSIMTGGGGARSGTVTFTVSNFQNGYWTESDGTTRPFTTCFALITKRISSPNYAWSYVKGDHDMIANSSWYSVLAQSGRSIGNGTFTVNWTDDGDSATGDYCLTFWGSVGYPDGAHQGPTMNLSNMSWTII